MARTGGVRGTYAKTEQFRLDVLDAALRVLSAHGFDATTLQRIADEVGRSKAGLLHHFGSRDGLLLAIVRHRDAVDRRSFPPGGPGDFEASIAIVAHNATVPGLVSLFAVTAALAASDASETDRRAFFVRRYAGTRAALARRIAQAQEAGLMRDDITAEAAAALILATMDGLQTQWLLDPAIDMAEHLRALIALLRPVPREG
ncbi:MAG: helix-turn-helix domain-containing protein [Candidatus Nanopelagicales bacterium]